MDSGWHGVEVVVVRLIGSWEEFHGSRIEASFRTNTILRPKSKELR
jgi:hypothetical protein